jgi:hypothetical protein
LCEITSRHIPMDLVLEEAIVKHKNTIRWETYTLSAQVNDLDSQKLHEIHMEVKKIADQYETPYRWHDGKTFHISYAAYDIPHDFTIDSTTKKLTPRSISLSKILLVETPYKSVG